MKNSQEIAIIIKKTAKSKGIAIGKMLSDCDLSVNTLSSMQSGGFFPRLEAINKIADYLEVSIDYLLGRTNIPNIVNIKSSNIVNGDNGNNSPLTVNESDHQDEMTTELVKAFKTLSFSEKMEIMNAVLEKAKAKQ